MVVSCGFRPFDDVKRPPPPPPLRPRTPPLCPPSATPFLQPTRVPSLPNWWPATPHPTPVPSPFPGQVQPWLVNDRENLHHVDVSKMNPLQKRLHERRLEMLGCLDEEEEESGEDGEGDQRKYAPWYVLAAHHRETPSVDEPEDAQSLSTIEFPVSMRETSLISSCGDFPFLPFNDLTLKEQFRVLSDHPDHADSEWLFPKSPRNCRIIRVPFYSDLSRRVVAVSSNEPPYSVFLLNVNSGGYLSILRRQFAMTPAVGLDCLPSDDDDPRIAIGSMNRHAPVKIFSAVTGEVVRTEIPHIEMWDILCNAEWGSVVVCGGSGKIAQAKFRGYGPWTWMTFEGHERDVIALAAGSGSSQKLLFSTGEDAVVRVWSVVDRSCLSVLKLPFPGQTLCFDENLNSLLVGLSNGDIELWDPRQARAFVKRVAYRKGGISDIAHVEDSCFVASHGDYLSLFDPLKGANQEGKDYIRRSQLEGAVSSVCVLPGNPERETSLMEELDRLGFLFLPIIGVASVYCTWE